jgi:hypothetical protein
MSGSRTCKDYLNYLVGACWTIPTALAFDVGARPWLVWDRHCATATRVPELGFDVSLQATPYILALTGAGLLIALVAWLPLALKKLPLSLPIVCIAFGAGIFSLPQVVLPPLPLSYPEITERFTEFVVIIALMGAGLKIDRVFHLHRWQVT